MMPPEVMTSVAGALIAKQVLGQIVQSSIKTPFDEHYFVVTIHKGVSKELPRMLLKDIGKLLSQPPSSIRRHVADHAVFGSAKGGCKICAEASPELKQQIQVHEDIAQNDTARVFAPAFVMTIDSVRQSARRSAR